MISIAAKNAGERYPVCPRSRRARRANLKKRSNFIRASAGMYRQNKKRLPKGKRFFSTRKKFLGLHHMFRSDIFISNFHCSGDNRRIIQPADAGNKIR